MNTKTKKIWVTIFFFILAGLFEIGGAYLVWIWLKDNLSLTIGILGGFILFFYAIIQTFQPSYFHRIYVAYGGVFIVMAMFAGWIFEGITPDNFDITGTIIALIGVGIIFYWPRKGEKIWQA